MRSSIEYIRNHLFVILLVLLIGGFVALAVSQRASTPSKDDVEIADVKTFGLTDRAHVNEDVDYGQVPPVGGKHSPTWVACDGKTYDQPLKNEHAVHSLEHGAVWITYRSGLDAASITKLEGKVKNSNYTMMSPYPDQPGKIMLSAWDHQLTVDSADDARIDQFLEKYRLGSQTPEPGASCQATNAGM
jgi:hypothetical protein